MKTESKNQEKTLNIGSTIPWKTLVERPRPERGFNMTSILGGLLHLKSSSGGGSVGSNSEEACFFDEAKGWGKQLIKHC
jgi:hypothetical protein